MSDTPWGRSELVPMLKFYLIVVLATLDFPLYLTGTNI
jgi:hypothetical protein